MNGHRRQENFVIKDVLRNQKSELKKFLDLDYGCLDELLSSGTMDLEEVKIVEETRSSIRNRRKLVNTLVKAVLTPAENKKRFFEVLKRNNQRHLAVCIEQNGRRLSRDHPESKCWPLDSARKSRITRNMRVLVEMLDPDNGLLREWSSSGGINYQQCCDIEQTSPQFNRNRKLLNFLLKRSIADYDLFVECLAKKKYGQRHLAEILKISEEDACTTESGRHNWKIELKRSIELNYGLLDDLVSEGLIKYEDQLDDLEAASSSLVQRGRVLDVMVKKSARDQEHFLKALKTTGQEHVACFITRNGCRYESDDKLFKCWPLDSQLESRITRNMCQLIELIKADVVFVNYLCSTLCINSLQKCDVDETRSEYAKTRKLLNFLLQSSIANYENFVECLKNTSQQHLAPMLENDVVVEAIDCTISNGSLREEKIVEKWKEVLNSNNRMVINEINAILHEQVHPGVDIIDMQPGSVRCYLLCRTPTDLMTFYQKLENGSLNVAMQSIFNSLLFDADMVQVMRTKGRLSASELQRRIEVFSKDIDAGGASEIAEGVAANGVSDFKESIWLTYDVLEPILLRVAAVLFKVNNVRLLLPRPDVTTLLTISSVCRDWCDVITGRRILRQRLKLTFKKLNVLPSELLKAAVLLRRLLTLHPQQSRDADVIVLKTLMSVFRRWKTAVLESGDNMRRRFKQLFYYNPQLLVTLNEPPAYSYGRRREVTGVTMLANYLYVVYKEYNKVEVFNCRDRFKKGKDIEVKEMKDPWDMEGCNKTMQLFISEWTNDVIWRVDLKAGVSDVFIRHGYSYGRLSLVENRLLVTSRDSLLMYDIHSGERTKNIPLTEDMDGHGVLHAIESNRESFFLCHGFLSNNTVSEIDSEGRVIRAFNNNKGQRNCGYLALDTLGRLLVADWNNNCVVILDERLKCKRILVDNKPLDNTWPWRLNYNKNTDRLTVGLYNGQVKIFEIKPVVH